ncbi:Lrp/AsnC family transcriptional regulator [Candidatus Pacearchaeota archaeon]|nr:Lrp/AsnC family transcriptional regulator [Candidatus Pacearchaeota archaeon]
MIKLDKKDRIILYELDKNSRQSNSRIAKKVGLSEQVVSYKIKRFIDNNLIVKCITFLNPAYLGYTHFKVYLRMQNISHNIERDFIKTLVNNSYSFWVVSSRGEWDIIVSFFSRNIKEFGKIFRDILNKYDKYIAKREVVAVEEAPSFTRGYLITETEKKEFEYGGIMHEIKLDKIDFYLLKLLSQNSRIPLIDIADKLKLTSEGIRQRIKKLEKNRIIQNYGMILNLKVFGYEHYLVSITLNKLDELTWRKLSNFVNNNQNILFMPKCIGSHDIDFEMEVKDNKEFNDIIIKFREEFGKQISNLSSNLITEQHKFDYFPMHKYVLFN